MYLLDLFMVPFSIYLWSFVVFFCFFGSNLEYEIYLDFLKLYFINFFCVLLFLIVGCCSLVNIGYFYVLAWKPTRLQILCSNKK